jgi:hypothetical protein
MGARMAKESAAHSRAWQKMRGMHRTERVGSFKKKAWRAVDSIDRISPGYSNDHYNPDSDSSNPDVKRLVVDARKAVDEAKYEAKNVADKHTLFLLQLTRSPSLEPTQTPMTTPSGRLRPKRTSAPCLVLEPSRAYNPSEFARTLNEPLRDGPP